MVSRSGLVRRSIPKRYRKPTQQPKIARIISNINTLSNLTKIKDPIEAIFANSERGSYYDFSDLSTMRTIGYEDYRGAYADLEPTSGSSIGLVRDIRLGTDVLGPEMITNTDFTTDTSGWSDDGSGTISWSSGTAVVDVVSYAGALQVVSGFIPGETYKLSVRGAVGVSPRIYIGQTTNPRAYTVCNLNGVLGDHDSYFVASATSHGIGLSGNDTETVSYDSISIKHVPGNHLYQATSTQRPTITHDGTIGYALGDGVDDILKTYGPLDLSNTDKITVMMALNRNVEATSILVELGTSYDSDGSFYVSTENVYTVSIGGPSYIQNQTNTTAKTQIEILSTNIDRSIAVRPAIWIDGSSIAGVDLIGGVVIGNFGSAYPLVLLARWDGSSTALLSQVKMYKFLIVDRLLSTSERKAIEAKWATELGVTLP